jgi:hypothetical protein
MAQYVVPCPAGDDYTAVDDVPVELARSRKVMGKVFRKHILSEGTLIHPKTHEHIQIDGAFMDALQRNFDGGIGDIVQVPLANDANQHVENPAANLGEVVGLERKAGKMYALIDARQDAERFGKTYLGASAFLSTNYTDTHTDRKVGPTLLHVAVTNRPYVTGLEDYEPVAASMADYTGDEDLVVLTPEDEMPMTRDEMLAALRDDHGIDVEALQARAERAGDTSELTAALTQALQSGGMQLSGDSGGVTAQDMVGAVAELAQLSNSQGEQIQGLLRDRASAEVRDYVRAGRLMPKSQDRAVELILSGDRAGLDAFLAPASEPYVRLAGADGIEGDTSEGQGVDVEAELARLTSSDATSRFFTPNGATKK